MPETKEMRFEFGKNWKRFSRRSFTDERCEIAKAHLLKFIGRDNLHGEDMLDIGCGSGIHSLGAFRAGCRRIFSFDYDANSVAATNLLRERAGNPSNWQVEVGDILDAGYVAKLKKWSFVYSWGVLHHTGNVWQAVRNAQSTVADNGLFYIALYSSDADVQPSKEFWLDVKQKYNSAGVLGKQRMQLWYVWRFYMNNNIRNFPQFVRRYANHRLTRGMDLFADVRDWLGGWPMEYTADQDVVDLLEQECGFKLENVATGQACSEFLFRRSGRPAQRTIVKDFGKPAAVSGT